MNAAYEFEMLKSYSVQIECIAVYDEYLVVSNCLGHVSWYVTSPTLQPLHTYKKLSKKPILQIAPMPKSQTIICLSAERGVSALKLSVSPDKMVQCHATDVPNTKGANCFAIDVQALAGSNTDKVGICLCVAVKKELKVYVWNDKTFLQLMSIDTRLDTPRTLMWCGHSIVIGCKNEYFLVNIETKIVSPLILTGTRVEPIIVKLSDTTFGLVKDSQIMVMSTVADGAKGEQIIRLDNTPYSIAYDTPYLLVGLGDKLRVQTAEPYDGNYVVRQEIMTNSKILKMFICKDGSTYAMSAMSIWCLKPVQFGVQIERLIEEKNFQLALKLAICSDESVDDKEKNETHIRKLYARNLFDEKKYQESMKEFSKLNIDPRYVIALFSNVWPQSVLDLEKKKDDKDTEMKIEAAEYYLVEVRRDVSKRLSNYDQQTDACEMNINKEELLEAIDNALLKCYLQSNDALIAPLIRLNHCGFSETETTLKNHKKYNELIILYQVRGLHREALEFLKQQSVDSESILNGPGKIIQYLQNMGPNDIGAVLEFSDWVLDRFPDRGLEIFTADAGEVEQWPRWRVYSHLAEKHDGLVVPYLEHVTRVWYDADGGFHDHLLRRYKESLGKGDRYGRGTSWPSSDAEERLLTFLKRSDRYDPEKALELFPISDEFVEERIIVLEKLGRHIQVLSIYVYKFNDVDRAIEYCDKAYASKAKNSNRIHVELLRLLVNPPNNWLVELGRVPRLPPNLEKTIEILNKYPTVISPSDALMIISNDIPIHRISQYLVIALETVISDRRHYQLSRGLLSSARSQMLKQKIFYEAPQFVLTKYCECSVCKMRFVRDSAFVKCVDGDIVHLMCYIETVNNQTP